MDDQLIKVLRGREERWNIRRSIAEREHHTLITITLCVPADYRNSEEFRMIFQRLCEKFWRILISNNIPARREGTIWNDDGPGCFVSVDAGAADAKRLCVKAEECIPGGRMLDIDVMDGNGVQISRSDISLHPRKCFICDNPAAVCVSRKLHTKDEVSACVERLKKQAEGSEAE